MSDSRMARFLRNRIEEQEYDPEEEVMKKVTLRIPESQVDDLDAIAGKLGMTRTACAEHFLSMSINEASVLFVEDPALAAYKGGLPASVVKRIEDHIEANGSDWFEKLQARQPEEVAA